MESSDYYPFIMTTIQDFKCIFCKESFNDKETLQTHFRKHGDPKFNQNETKSGSNASQSSGNGSKGGSELVGCDVCSEMFLTISKAITHKHKVHPDHDAKYFCPWCGKLFTMKHLYNKHVQANHADREDNEDKPFHCDPCMVDFCVSTAMLYHNKFFHRQDTDIPAFGHSKKLKTYNQEVLQVYYCSFCGEEYVNKVNLHKHTVDDHSDENQSPDEVLRCPLCDAIFYHLDAYEVHLTFHSTEDVYSEHNELISSIIDFSLEAVPPSTEKVINSEPQQDAETTMTEMSVEDILQMAVDQSEEQGVKKSKKHKKHKKSKKSAITLDEFLNMNTDVFGEGLDIQGVEEVPTRAITKRLKLNKKSHESYLGTVPEIDKLRKQGIIIKKKSNESAKPLKKANNSFDETMSNTKVELSSSSEVLSKLINQSNNQIQIFKTGSQDKNLNKITCKELIENKPTIAMDNENMECDSTKEEFDESINQSSSSKKEVISKQISHISSLDNSDYSEKNTSQDSQDNSNSKSECPSPSSNRSKENLNDFMDDDEFVTNKNNVNVERITSMTGTIASCNNTNSEKGSDSNMAENNINTGASSNSNDAEEFSTKIEKQENIEKDKTSASSEPLSALKHLSHLITVKSVNKTKTAVEGREDFDKKKVLSENISTFDKKSSDNTVTSTNNQKDVNHVSPICESTLGTLKNLSKNITLKCLPRKNDNTKTETSDFDMDDEFEQKSIEIKKNQYSDTEILETDIESANVNSKELAITDVGKCSPHSDCSDNFVSKTEISNDDKSTSKSNSDILKHLTNITAKPLHITKTGNNFTPIKSSPVSTNITNKNFTQTVQRVETSHDGIEILNIDDSDSDDMDNVNQQIDCKTSVTPLTHSNKNIIVKTVTPSSQSSKNELNKAQEQEAIRDETDINNSFNQKSSVSKSTNSTFVSQKSTTDRNTAIKHVLQTLGKHITVKSNSSPSQETRIQETNWENNFTYNDGCSDTDSDTGKVKITEMCEDYDSAEEMKTNEINENIVIQTPDGSCSENETNVNEGFDDQESDFESQIKINAVKKPEENLQSLKTSSLSSFKNISKDITIKSLNNNSSKGETTACNQNSDNSQNVNNSIALKTMRPNNRTQQEIQKNSKVQVLGQKLNQSFSNQKMATTSKQVNTVNKEVSVKTFQTQTKTVIEEITTTVTKTIKTVNQATKEEVRNVQSSSTPMIPTRFQGIRVNQPQKNLQGITVRHATVPGMVPKIRNPAPTRPVLGSMVGPSNQLVPVSSSMVPKQILRPNKNVARLSTPRMQSQQKMRPTVNQSLQGPRLGRPVKVSPNLISPSNKRPNSDEQTGPFSCFKKSKESLIPGSDIHVLSNNDEMKTEYSATMQMSKSNFTSKTVKGNSVVTSSQIKTEMSTSSQHLSKLHSMAGLKVVKTSQSKQVQESEQCGMKRTTLEAIEKLQKQGLLVKKPRVEHGEESEHSDVEGDDNINYNSMDENDD